MRPGFPGVPLRLSADRILFYGALCAVVASLPFIVAPHRLYEIATVHDFANYWSAGATVGTPVLTDVSKLTQWQTSHHLAPQPFVYPPGFAWVYAPLTHLPPMTAMIVEQITMIALFAVAGWLIAKVYKFPLWFALVSVFAWGPTMGTIEDGQNTGLALVLVLVATLALVNHRPVLTGLAIGLLLYKPTDAVVLILLLAVRPEWRALGIAGLCAAGWYFLSVGGSGGDWRWPLRYAATVHAWYAPHSAGNSHMVFTVPTMLLATGVPLAIAFCAGAVVVLLALPLLARVSALEAASMATFVGVATSLHAWSYTAALLLPGVCYVMTRLVEPWRTRVIAAAYVCASIGAATAYGGAALAIICISGTVWWLSANYLGRPSAPDAV